MNELALLDCSTIQPFTLSGLVKLAKVIKVYDGDTITVVFKHKSEYNRWSCRLYGIDTPELHPHSGDADTTFASDKRRAEQARDFLSSQILNQIVSIECFEFDKYGRLLVTITKDGTDINALMITNKHAVPYFGGAKQTNTI